MMDNLSGEDDEGPSPIAKRARKRGRPWWESTVESDPPKVVKALPIPEEHHAKLLVTVSASNGSKPMSPDNLIKMALLIKKKNRRHFQ